METVFANTDMPSGAKLLWMYLLCFQEDGFKATHEELAEATGAGRSSVIRQIKLLEDAGWISVDRSAYTNAYTTRLPK